MQLLSAEELARGQQLCDELGEHLKHPENRSRELVEAHREWVQLLADHRQLVALESALAFIHQSEIDRGLSPTVPNGDVLAYAKSLGWKDPSP